jgi:hypothetical protein
MADAPQKRCSSRSVASGGTLDLNGFNQTVSGVTNAGPGLFGRCRRCILDFQR